MDKRVDDRQRQRVDVADAVEREVGTRPDDLRLPINASRCPAVGGAEILQL
jgi:hypothetical protein